MNFDRHIGRPVKMECINADGEKDVFYIKPLPFEYIAEYYDLVKSLMEHKDLFKSSEELSKLSPEEQEKTTANLLNMLKPELIKLISKLELATLKESYPTEKEDKLKAFANAKFFDLLNIMLEVNSNAKSIPKN